MHDGAYSAPSSKYLDRDIAQALTPQLSIQRVERKLRRQAKDFFHLAQEHLAAFELGIYSVDEGVQRFRLAAQVGDTRHCSPPLLLNDRSPGSFEIDRPHGCATLFLTADGEIGREPSSQPATRSSAGPLSVANVDEFSG